MTLAILRDLLSFARLSSRHGILLGRSAVVSNSKSMRDDRTRCDPCWLSEASTFLERDD
jgi:hypothetical protein